MTIEVQRERFPCRQSQARGYKKTVFLVQSDRHFKTGGDGSPDKNNLKTRKGKSAAKIRV